MTTARLIILTLLIVGLIPYLLYRILNKILCRETKVSASIILFGLSLFILGILIGMSQALLLLGLPDMPLSSAKQYLGAHCEALEFLLKSPYHSPKSVSALSNIAYALIDELGFRLTGHYFSSTGSHFEARYALIQGSIMLILISILIVYVWQQFVSKKLKNKSNRSTSVG